MQVSHACCLNKGQLKKSEAFTDSQNRKQVLKPTQMTVRRSLASMNFFNLPFACSHGLLSLAKFEQLPVGTKATKDSLQTCAPYGALRSYGVGPLAKLKSRKHFSLRGLLPSTTSAQVWAISRRTSIPSVRLAWSRECRDVKDF